VLNLVEGFSVSVKHYLRGEEGIRYEDLYHLTKYLPAYSLPAGKPMPEERGDSSEYTSVEPKDLPLPTSTPTRNRFSSNNFRGSRNARPSMNPDGTPVLLPSRNPPPYSLWDVFPLTLLVKPPHKERIQPWWKDCTED